MGSVQTICETFPCGLTSGTAGPGHGAPALPRCPLSPGGLAPEGRPPRPRSRSPHDPPVPARNPPQAGKSATAPTVPQHLSHRPAGPLIERRPRLPALRRHRRGRARVSQQDCKSPFCVNFTLLLPILAADRSSGSSGWRALRGSPRAPLPPLPEAVPPPCPPRPHCPIILLFLPSDIEIPSWGRFALMKSVLFALRECCCGPSVSGRNTVCYRRAINSQASGKRRAVIATTSPCLDHWD